MNFEGYNAASLTAAVELVNSHNPASGRDDLPDEEALTRFLQRRPGRYPEEVTPEDLRDIKRLRAQLRSVFEAHAESEAAEVLNGLLEQAQALPRLTSHDGDPWHLHYTTDGTALGRRLAAETAMALAVVITDEGFDRLRTCCSDDCNDAFVDVSKNRSRRYCSPQVCGNRASVAAYRARRKGEG